MNYRVKDLELAREGSLKIEWAENHMPVLMLLRRRHREDKPFRNLKIGAVLHVTKETAVLVKAFKDAGAEVLLAGSNPLSTQDDVAASLVEYGVRVYAWRGQTP
ncbi:MAG: adenosylhomocysteinase, partial [Thermosphaera sp.]